MEYNFNKRFNAGHFAVTLLLIYLVSQILCVRSTVSNIATNQTNGGCWTTDGISVSCYTYLGQTVFEIGGNVINITVGEASFSSTSSNSLKTFFWGCITYSCWCQCSSSLGTSNCPSGNYYTLRSGPTVATNGTPVVCNGNSQQKVGCCDTDFIPTSANLYYQDFDLTATFQVDVNTSFSISDYYSTTVSYVLAPLPPNVYGQNQEFFAFSQPLPEISLGFSLNMDSMQPYISPLWRCPNYNDYYNTNLYFCVQPPTNNYVPTVATVNQITTVFPIQSVYKMRVQTSVSNFTINFCSSLCIIYVGQQAYVAEAGDAIINDDTYNINCYAYNCGDPSYCCGQKRSSNQPCNQTGNILLCSGITDLTVFTTNGTVYNVNSTQLDLTSYAFVCVQSACFFPQSNIFSITPSQVSNNSTSNSTPMLWGSPLGFTVAMIILIPVSFFLMCGFFVALYKLCQASASIL